ncbi:hypothetical protein RRSWK_06350 [Rhodopirellula sp. SWK7]|nr:hypothetical protein RRSWK_06350 [Rhodopirellula sp. SWK7]
MRSDGSHTLFYGLWFGAVNATPTFGFRVSLSRLFCDAYRVVRRDAGCRF